jgi:hypothetical protein
MSRNVLDLEWSLTMQWMQHSTYLKRI